MSQIIKTLSNIDTAFDIADYPSCVFYIPITEDDAAAATNYTIHELVLDQSIAMAPAIPSDETGAFSGGALTIAGTILSVSDKAETLPNLGSTKDVLYMVVADFPSAEIGVQVGGGGGASVLLNRTDAAGKSAIDDDVAPAVLTNTAVDANTEAAALYTDRANTDLYLVESDGSAITSPQNIVLTADGELDLEDSAAGSVSLISGMVIYGAAIFTFDTIPSDVLAGVSWMNYQWRQNNKVLYPAWANVE